MVQQARDLELAVIAEGIEYADIVDALAESGYHLGLGFDFMRPSSSDDVSQRMDGGDRARPEMNSGLQALLAPAPTALDAALRKAFPPTINHLLVIGVLGVVLIHVVGAP